MGGPLGCLLGFVLAITALLFIAVLSIVGKVRYFISSISGKKKGASSTFNDNNQQTKYHNQTQTSASRKKVFDDNEGEYIEYEEIK